MNITESSWYKRAKFEAEKPIPKNERVSSIGFFLISLLMFIYLLLLQSIGSDFYTDDFGYLEMTAQYGFWIMWMITAFLEGVLGKRFASRAFDVFGGILFACFALLWLTITFPYNFEYFTDAMPELIVPLFSWITNSIGRVILLLAFIFHLVAVFYSPFAYKFVQKKDFSRFRK